MIVGILGCGTIANVLIHKIENKKEIKVKYFYDRDVEKAENLARTHDGTAILDFHDMIDKVDLVLESASQSSVKELILDVLKKGKDVIIMSVGALLNKDLWNEMKSVSKKTGAKIHIPSGAIAGLDAIKAGSVGEIRKVLLTTKKSPSSLGMSIDKEEILFYGKASEAVKIFPLNINVAATLSIASNLDIDVKILVDPKVDRNIHQIFVEGDFGKFITETENLPSKSNPKTSILAAYSAIQLLNSLTESFNLGA
ncbi:MAG: aspartate dehydrogenase [Methanobrevibacter sp.]|jgi:aspartate dehydrogenase|nr:aspartate dehydrogenase [Candidatus Methanovirga basalitermitum]